MLTRGPMLACRSGARFTPRDLGGAVLAFWDAERAESITQSGGLVSSWRDLIGNLDAAQATGSLQPAFASTLNGRPEVVFDGTDDYLEVASQPLPAAAQPCEIWLLGRQTGIAADATTRVGLSYGGDAIATQRRVGRAVVSAADVPRASIGNGTTAFNSDAPGAFSGIHVVRSVIGAAETRTDFDGVAGTPVAVVPATGTSRIRLGATANTVPTSFWKGGINAAFVLNPISDGQAARLLAFLKARGGVA